MTCRGAETKAIITEIETKIGYRDNMFAENARRQQVTDHVLLGHGTAVEGPEASLSLV